MIFLATHDLASGSTQFETTVLAGAPLVHGTGLAEALRALSRQGRVVFVDSDRFDPRLVWQSVEIEGVATLTIGGDDYARPLLAALPNVAAARSLKTLKTISSSGAKLTPDVARGLEAALPHVLILDGYDGPEQPPPLTKRMTDPSDVEARLCKHSSISDCVIVGISDPRAGRRVVAVVQVSEGHYLDAPELAAWCQAHLPSTMTPGRFVFVDKIERSPSGRADYEGLRHLAIERLVGEQ
jgi:acyl-CoA synthetase (AMP-forming)/AMP-acid ligase II